MCELAGKWTVCEIHQVTVASHTHLHTGNRSRLGVMAQTTPSRLVLADTLKDVGGGSITPPPLGLLV